MTGKPITSELQTEEMNTTPRTLISAVLAVRNEERHIELVLKSLMRQEQSNFALEIIVVDGDSSDATRVIVERIAKGDPRVKLAINKRQKTPYAFNLGIQMAQGEYICICGAHTTYARDYIVTCLEELKVHGAGGCGGRELVRPGSGGLQAKLVAWALGHPFGTSTGSTRTRGAGFADTIPYPIFLKSTLMKIGGYDTQLHRNQDNDLSQKLRAHGYKLYITDKTSCEYFVSPSLISLSRYSLKTGFWNIVSFRKNPSSMSMRHFVPGAFVATLLFCFVLFLFSAAASGDLQSWLRSPLFLLGGVYSTASLVAACHVWLREKSVAALLLPIIFLLLHVSYGLGTLSAIASNARPQSYDLNRGHDITEYS